MGNQSLLAFFESPSSRQSRRARRELLDGRWMAPGAAPRPKKRKAPASTIARTTIPSRLAREEVNLP